jgi:YggT family protein
VFLGGAVLLGAIGVLDWLVRTRRISPFSGIARFMRRTVDPLLSPIERRVVQAGGLPASAPLWALGAAVLGGIVFLSLLSFARAQVIAAGAFSRAGPRGVTALVVSWAFQILRIALLVRVISSWVRVSPYSRWIRWSYTLTEPLIRPLRRVIPPIGMIDITPIIAYFALSLAQSLVTGLILP